MLRRVKEFSENRKRLALIGLLLVSFSVFYVINQIAVLNEPIDRAPGKTFTTESKSDMFFSGIPCKRLSHDTNGI